VLEKPDMRIPAATVAALLEASAERSGCANFGLQMAESRRLSDFGAISLLMKHQRTLREVLTIAGRYRHLLNEALVIEVEDADEVVIVREELVVGTNLATRQAYELAVGTAFRMFRAFLGDRWQPYSVHFTHSAPQDRSVHRRLFGPNVRFDSDFNGLVCAAADLDGVNPAADAAMASYALQFLKTLPRSELGSATLDVRKAIYLSLPAGNASIERIARSLGINVRTLQRRLDAEKTSFSDLLNAVRRDLAVRYLANKSCSLAQVAEMLGYSQLSSFTRWFSAEFGATPTRWRSVHARKQKARG
jgi:AraC-like DNA-binding protein